jgi:hypothetical protein
MTLVDLRDFMPMNNCDWTNEHRDWRPWTSLNNDASKFDMVKIGRIVVYLNLLLEGRIHWLNSFFLFAMVSKLGNVSWCLASYVAFNPHVMGFTASTKLDRCFLSIVCQKIDGVFHMFFKKSFYSKQQKPDFSCCPPDFPPKISPESRSPGVKLHLEEPAKESKRCGMWKKSRCGTDAGETFGWRFGFYFFFVKIKTKNMWTKSGVFWGAYFKT